MEELDLKLESFDMQIQTLKRTISESNGTIVASTETRNGLSHAFYLYINRALVEKSSYSLENRFQFEAIPNNATISVKFFYLDESGNKFSVKEEMKLTSSLIEKANQIFLKDAEKYFFEECLTLLMKNEISTLIVSFEKRYVDLDIKKKSHKYVQLINYIKGNSSEKYDLQVLSKIAIMLYEDRYTVMAHAGVCINTGSIIEANRAIIKLQNEYQVETDKIIQLKYKLVATFTKLAQEFDLASKLTNVIDNYKYSDKEILAHKDQQVLSNNYNEEQFADILRITGADEVIKLLDSDESLENKVKATLALRAAKVVRTYEKTRPEDFKRDTNLLASYAYGLDKSESTLRNVYFAYQRILEHDKLKEVIALLRLIAGDDPTQRQRKLLWSTPDHLITLANQVPDRKESAVYQPMKGRVCYVIHNSLPYSSGGYATRGHGLLTALLDQGIDIYAMTRPGFPHDVSQVQIKDVALEDNINGATYKRILTPSRRDYSNYEYMLKAVESYKEAFKKDKPQLVIAASNHLDGLPVMFAARELGLPFIYEIRGFWEVTRLSKYPEFEHDPMFEVEKRLEAVTAQHADHIFTLTQGMVDELESRGVHTQDRITLLPNSCNVERFNPTTRDTALAAELGVPLDIPVIGYVGTLVSYEGLDDLALACSTLKQLGYEFRLLIVGNENATGQGKGSIVAQIQNIAENAGFDNWLIMPGRIPFEEVERYYSLIDIAPFPRKAWPVCEMVPPMKTLEALSMKKAVIVSSNKALTEMIEHDVNGRIFERGNVGDLVLQLQYLLDHTEKWSDYGEAGRKFVENERTWQRTAEKACAIINQLL